MARPPDPPATDEFSSPACAMHEVDATYAGYATPGELAELLMDLLRAVSLMPDGADLAQTLKGHIEKFGAMPPRAAVSDGPPAPMHLIRKLDEILPRVRDDRLHHDLRCLTAQLRMASNDT